MSIIQKTIFGDNTIYLVPPNYTRSLSNELKEEIIKALKELEVSSVSIRFEDGGETREFVEIVKSFLESKGFKVYPNGVMMSEIKRNEFTIQKHPGDETFAMIKIGPTI